MDSRRATALALLVAIASACEASAPEPAPTPAPTPAAPPRAAPSAPPAPLPSAFEADAPQACRVTTWDGAEAQRLSLEETRTDTLGRVTLHRREQLLRPLAVPTPRATRSPLERTATPERSVTVVTSYTYDDDGRTITRARDTGGDGEIEERAVMRYDDAGRQLAAEVDRDGDGVAEWRQLRTYDTAGNERERQATAIAADGSEAPVERIERRYDDAGNVVRETRTLGEADVETIERRYDTEGRLVALSAQRVPAGARVERREHERDAAGNATVTRIDYDSDGQVDRIVSRTFDSAGRVLEEIETDAFADSAARAQRWFTYDAQGRLLTRAEGPDHATAERQELRYDDAVDLHEPAAVAYVFPAAPARDFETTQVHERVGEELVRTDFFGPDGALDFARRFERDAAGRLLSRSDWRPGPHDRLTLQRHWRYSYDEAGRLVEERCDGCTPDAPLADGRDDVSITYEHDGSADTAPAREIARFGLPELVERRELSYGDRGLLAETRCWGCPEARGSDEPARVTTEYDGAGRLIREARFAPGEATPVSVRELTWGDAGSTPIREVRRDGSGRVLETVERELDGAGRVVTERSDGGELSVADGAPDVVVRYEYECAQ